MMMINVDIAFWSVLCWKINIDNIACLCLCLCIYIYTYIVLHVIFAYMDWLIDLIDVVHACPFSTWYMIMNSYIHTHKDTHIHIFAYSHFYIHTVIYIYIVFLPLLLLARVFAHPARVVSKKSSTSQVDVDSFFPRSYDLTSPAQESLPGVQRGRMWGEPQPQQPKCPCFSF